MFKYISKSDLIEREADRGLERHVIEKKNPLF